MVEVAPVTSITRSLDCPTFSQGSLLPLSHLRRGEYFRAFYSVLFSHYRLGAFSSSGAVFRFLRPGSIAAVSARRPCPCDFLPAHAALCHCFKHNSM